MFAERLKNARNIKGLTQKVVAEYLEIFPKAYQRYEYGEREPSFELLVKLADYLDISTDYLLGRTDNPHSHKG